MPLPRVRRSRDRGMVTAELAAALPALVLVAVLCVWAVGAVATHVRCLDAARAAARELARGEQPEVVRAVATERAPPGAQVEFAERADGLVSVRVVARVGLPGGWGGGPGVQVGGDAVAAVEYEPPP